MNKNSTLKKPNLIYDVGLPHGQDTDFYLKKGFEVVAFEANPENAAVCRKKFAAAPKESLVDFLAGGLVLALCAGIFTPLYLLAANFFGIIEDEEKEKVVSIFNKIFRRNLPPLPVIADK